MSKPSHANASHPSEKSGESFWILEHVQSRAWMMRVDPWNVQFVGKCADPKRFKTKEDVVPWAVDNCRCLRLEECKVRKIVKVGETFLPVAIDLENTAPSVFSVDDIINFCG
jgi:hypothetical protein